MKHSHWIVGVIALLALAPPAFGDIYRWEGADGVIHFSNQPPPPGVKVIDTIEEAPYDAAADRRRQEEDRRARQEFEKRSLEERQAALAAREREAQLKLQEAERLLEQSRPLTDPDEDCDDEYFFRYGSCGSGLIIHRNSGRSGPRDLYRGVYRDNNNLYYKRPDHRPGPGTRPPPGDPSRPRPRDAKSAVRSEKAPSAAGEPENPVPPGPAPGPSRKR